MYASTVLTESHWMSLDFSLSLSLSEPGVFTCVMEMKIEVLRIHQHTLPRGHFFLFPAHSRGIKSPA
jgi:hypothetical protein